MFRSSYEVTKVTTDTVFLVDLNVGKSVTNDAENVVAEILTEYGNKRIIYRDSDGHWDELVHNGSKFTNFAPYKGTF